MTKNRTAATVAFIEGKAGKGGTVFTDGKTIYSYGTHFPMGRHEEDGSVLVNVEKRSRTTSHHQSALRKELAKAGYVSTEEFVTEKGSTFVRWRKE